MVIAFLFTACNNQDYEFQLIETNENFTLDVKMLSFTSQEQLNSFVRQDFFNNVDFGLTTRVNDNTFEFPTDFKSMYDEYKEAMNVAESYYEREGGYEEFKEKYPNFYYPEEGKDFSAYLPVSNVNLAKFITPEGNVMIGNKVYNMCDINSYSQLDSLGLTLQLDDTPFYLATRATKTFTNLYSNAIQY
jgi:hypothetical protein